MKKIFAVLLTLAVLSAAVFVFAGCDADMIDTPQDGASSETDSEDTTQRPDGGEGTDTDDASGDAVLPHPDGDVLVVYFSYSGNTRRVAQYIGEVAGGTTVEIAAEQPYTAADVNYNDRNSRCQTERRDDARPAISRDTYDKIDMAAYRTVLLGYPIWNGEEPMIVRTFIEHYDNLVGKRVYTFSTSASSPAVSVESMRARYGQTDFVANLHLTSATLGSAETRVREWITQQGLLPKDSTEENTMYLKIGATALTATLADNRSAKALIELLRRGDVTIEMHDYARFEKVGPLGVDLPTADEQITTQAGDLILYQGNSFVIYYDVNRWNFTRLGKIDNITQDELKTILGDGDVTVTLTLQP